MVHGLAVVPAGGGTKADWGARLSTVDIIVDTVRLAGWQFSQGRLPLRG